MSGHRITDDTTISSPTPGDSSADSPSAADFSYSRKFAERSAQRAFSEGMDAAGMALSLRALEEAESGVSRPNPESVVKKILEERSAYTGQDAAKRILDERRQRDGQEPSRG